MSAGVRPASGQHVLLERPGRGRVEARVHSSSDGDVALVPYLSTGTAFGVVGEYSASVEFTTARGIHRFAGGIREAVRDAEAVDFERRLGQVLIDGRAFTQSGPTVPVWVWAENGRTGAVHQHTVEVHPSGLLLGDTHALSRGNAFWFELRAPVTGHDRIVRFIFGERDRSSLIAA